MRINRFLTDSGFCSRREADRHICDGRVAVNGRPAVLGEEINPENDIVRFDGKIIRAREENYVYLAFNKPSGVTCTSDSERRDNIIDYIGYPERIFTIGRLDRDSEGLILLTNDGSMVNRILRAGNRHEKEYLVTVDKACDQYFFDQMSRGVEILGQRTQAARLTPVSANVFRIVLTQGLNRQIRRMCEALGYTVTRLTRLRIMHISLGSLKSGSWRYLTAKELEELRRLTAHSRQQAERTSPPPSPSQRKSRRSAAQTSSARKESVKVSKEGFKTRN